MTTFRGQRDREGEEAMPGVKYSELAQEEEEEEVDHMTEVDLREEEVEDLKL